MRTIIVANYDYEREREINEIGRDKVASNNKKHAMKVQKRKEELAKKVSSPEKAKGGKSGCKYCGSGSHDNAQHYLTTKPYNSSKSKGGSGMRAGRGGISDY